MAINISGELFAATSKGKLGSAKQIFLDGDTENVEDKLKNIDSGNTEINNLITQLQNTITELQTKIQTVEDNSTKVVIVTPTKWAEMIANGTVQEGVLYGVLEKDSTDEEDTDSTITVVIDTDSNIMSIEGQGVSYDEESEILTVEGEYDETTGILTIDCTKSSGSGQTTELNDDTLTVSNMSLSEDGETLTLTGELDESGEVLTITY